MKRSIAIALGGVLVALAAASGLRDVARGVTQWSQLGPVPPGLPAPEFRVWSLDGEPMTGDDLRGSVAVVTFWATWCGACRDELAELDALHAGAYDGDDGVRFLAVNHDGGLSRPQATATVEHYRQATGMALPCVLDDGSASRAFRVRPIPHTVVLDRDGMIRHVHQGRVSAETIHDEVQRLLALARRQ